METKGIEVRGRGKREGGGGEGDCSEREGEAKGIDARGGLYAQATTCLWNHRSVCIYCKKEITC